MNHEQDTMSIGAAAGVVWLLVAASPVRATTDDALRCDIADRPETYVLIKNAGHNVDCERTLLLMAAGIDEALGEGEGGSELHCGDGRGNFLVIPDPSASVLDCDAQFGVAPGVTPAGCRSARLLALKAASRAGRASWSSFLPPGRIPEDVMSDIDELVEEAILSVVDAGVAARLAFDMRHASTDEALVRATIDSAIVARRLAFITAHVATGHEQRAAAVDTVFEVDRKVEEMLRAAMNVRRECMEQHVQTSEANEIKFP